MGDIRQLKLSTQEGANIMLCINPNCNSNLPDGTVFCQFCGARQPFIPPAPAAPAQNPPPAFQPWPQQQPAPIYQQTQKKTNWLPWLLLGLFVTSVIICAMAWAAMQKFGNDNNNNNNNYNGNNSGYSDNNGNYDDSISDGNYGNNNDNNSDYGNNPQTYIPHPNMYKETGVSGQVYDWNFTVKSGEYGIVGGYSVNGLDGGTYKGFGPGTYNVKVIDGFISVVTAQWGANEFDYRVQQAITYNWAHANIDRGPIPS